MMVLSSLRVILVLLVAWHATAQSQQQLYMFNITEPIDGLSTTCTQVLNQPVACNPILHRVDGVEVHADDTLNTVCTNTCATAWTNYLRRVNGACGTSRYTGDDGMLYLPLYRIQPVFEAFQSMCLRNSAGRFCKAVIRDVLGIDPVAQTRSSGLGPLPTTATCDGCFLSSLAQVLGMPYSSGSLYSTALSELQVSCRTTIAVTSPTKSTWSIPPATTLPAPSCRGTTYTIKAGDTCQSIAMAQGFSTAQLVEANGLVAYCRSFPGAGATICMPDSLKCTPYALRVGDNCNRIAAANKVPYAQIVSWNPEVGELCGNIERLTNTTMVICISTPGGAWVDPSPAPSSTSSSSVDTIFTLTGTGMMSTMPSATATIIRDVLAPVANASRQDCEVYVTPPVLMNETMRTWSYDCEDVARVYGVTVSNLLEWNPSVNATGGTLSACEMSGTQQYCVQPVARKESSITSNCSMTALAESRMSTCRDLTGLYNITTNALAAWNPSVGGGACDGYRVGMKYCVAVSNFKSPDTISNCAYWATADRADPSLCAAFESRYKLEHARFIAWNPSLLSDCTGAVRGYMLCVGTPTVHPGFP
ncbi:carbohydrate-binding module family 50 protein [Podospora aff. communis PSN243]|uniref:Carbohydrate-binding module family 50 protein n=1 Tax=Podospora aff. communis PSN243 TaxID=3040156 RepID=A0AAV9G1G9_9PEZI|nr:carbohydrate-binding module family 50 protein [Podospora aff. communis PSN243]